VLARTPFAARRRLTLIGGLAPAGAVSSKKEARTHESNRECGLIQASNARATGTIAEIQKAMLDKHLPMIDDAGKKGVQILCLQEIFNGPTSARADPDWYGAAEAIPGPTTSDAGLRPQVQHGWWCRSMSARCRASTTTAPR